MKKFYLRAMFVTAAIAGLSAVVVASGCSKPAEETPTAPPAAVATPAPGASPLESRPMTTGVETRGKP